MDGMMSAVAMELIEQVATETDTDPLELPPLYDTIDPEAIDTCITQAEGMDLSFVYAGVPVTIERTGEIRLGEESSAAAIWNADETPVQTTD